MAYFLPSSTENLHHQFQKCMSQLAHGENKRPCRKSTVPKWCGWRSCKANSYIDGVQRGCNNQMTTLSSVAWELEFNIACSFHEDFVDEKVMKYTAWGTACPDLAGAVLRTGSMSISSLQFVKSSALCFKEKNHRFFDKGKRLRPSHRGKMPPATSKATHESLCSKMLWAHSWTVWRMGQQKRVGGI